MPRNEIPVVVVVGNLAAGKSSVCRIVQQIGFPTYDFDEATLRLAKENPLRQTISSYLGRSVYDKNDEYSLLAARAALADKPSIAQAFNALLRSSLRADFAGWVQSHRLSANFVFCEMHFPSPEDMKTYGISKVVSVHSSSESRLERLRATIEQLLRTCDLSVPDVKTMLGFDLTLAEGLDFTFRLSNDGTLAELEAEVQKLLSRL